MNPHFYEIYDAEAIEVIQKMGDKMHQALASLYLEGTALSIESLQDLKLLEAGNLTEEKLTARLLARG